MTEIQHLISLESMRKQAETQPREFITYYTEQLPTLDNIQHLKQLKFYYIKALLTLYQNETAETEILDLLTIALDEQDYAGLAQLNLLLGICYHNLGMPQKVMPCLENSYKAAKQSRDISLVVNSILQLGWYALIQGDAAASLKYYRTADKRCPDTEIDAKAKIKLALGSTYFKLQQLPQAMTELNIGYEFAVQSDDFERQINYTNNLCTLYSALDSLDKAEQIVNKGLIIARKHDLYMQVQHLSFNLGTLRMKQERYQSAIEIFEQCQALAAESANADPEYHCQLHSNIAGCYRYLHQPDKALEHLHQAQDIAAKTKNRGLLHMLEINNANLLLSLGKLPEARRLIDSGLKYFRKQQLYDNLIITQNNLAEYYKLKGDYLKATDTLSELNSIYREYMKYVARDNNQSGYSQWDVSQNNYDHKAKSQRSAPKNLPVVHEQPFVGVSIAHKKVLETAFKAAGHPNASVLITGESGTGKELIARFIHNNSIRAGFPMVSVNVAAISSSLAESEFFGHTRGAFTGAVADHQGYFEQAKHGTLYLDEIGDMPIELQAKLLRVLEARVVTPVGSRQSIPIDCRILSSTNQNLAELVDSKLFRLDLWHRLNTIEIEIPPLRKRQDDIEPLLRHWLEHIAKECKRRVPRLDRSFVDLFVNYRFPGNVRELKNMVERLIILNPDSDWDYRVLQILPILNSNSKLNKAEHKNLAELNERDRIIDALDKADGVQKDAAKLLGMSESTLCRRIKKYHLELYSS